MRANAANAAGDEEVSAPVATADSRPRSTRAPRSQVTPTAAARPAADNSADSTGSASTADNARDQADTTMEAMASGLPVVAARSGALAELVSHRGNGFLVAPGRGDQLAAGLDSLLSDPGLRAGMATESLRIIGGHERHRWLAEWESLYGLLTATGAGEWRR